MPKYRCQYCGAIFYGWGVGKVCRECGGTLKAVNGAAKRREINEEKKNPYVGMSTREDVDFGKGKKIDNSQKKLF
ncbi:hypothetical protein ES708_20803 [subsurface metagenome]